MVGQYRLNFPDLAGIAAGQDDFFVVSKRSFMIFYRDALFFQQFLDA